MKNAYAETKTKTLREYLKAATAHSHDRLDTSMRPAADWRSREDYGRFLRVQYCARLPVEHWLSAFAPADLRPPKQTHLLARDLNNLGVTITTGAERFGLEYKSRATALGAAWVLAGSSLGNQAMLRDMQGALPHGERWPHNFLGGREMIDFWKTLRSRVETFVHEHDAHEAARAATVVFDHFLTAARVDRSQSELVGAQ